MSTAMIGAGILQPVVALAIWTMVMWVWMYATRIPAINKAGIDAGKMVGTIGASLRSQLPDTVSWKADNYNHLHEAPTVFYAVALLLAITGHGDGLAASLGWAYFGLRFAHSLVQVTVNKVMLRFILFALSSFVLMALTYLAACAVF